MSELLTTRELQRLLKVDRITIYRMLEQGRLPGFKVGGQWRFSSREIEEWLEAQRDVLTLSEEVTIAPAPSTIPLPLHCVQNVQDVFAEALDVAAVTTDRDGNPLTRLSHMCSFCDRILSAPEGRRRCMEAWKAGVPLATSTPAAKTCHAGLSCMSVPVQVAGNVVAIFSACQFAVREAALAQTVEAATLRQMATELGLDEGELAAHRADVRVLSADDAVRVSRLLQRMSATLSDIGDERLALLSRLERIAEMTRV